VPADNPAACVAGSWQMQDITPLLTTVLPPETLESNQITLTGTEGIFRYDFTPDGMVMGSAENFKVLGQTKRGPFTLDVVANLNGQGTGSYIVDPKAQEIGFSNLVDKGFSLDVTVAGISVLKQDSRELGLWFGGESEARVPYECSGTTLVLTINIDGQSIPVTLNRVNP